MFVPPIPSYLQLNATLHALNDAKEPDGRLSIGDVIRAVRQQVGNATRSDIQCVEIFLEACSRQQHIADVSSAAVRSIENNWNREGTELSLKARIALRIVSARSRGQSLFVPVIACAEFFKSFGWAISQFCNRHIERSDEYRDFLLENEYVQSFHPNNPRAANLVRRVNDLVHHTLLALTNLPKNEARDQIGLWLRDLRLISQAGFSSRRRPINAENLLRLHRLEASVRLLAGLEPVEEEEEQEEFPDARDVPGGLAEADRAAAREREEERERSRGTLDEQIRDGVGTPSEGVIDDMHEGRDRELPLISESSSSADAVPRPSSAEMLRGSQLLRLGNAAEKRRFGDFLTIRKVQPEDQFSLQDHLGGHPGSVQDVSGTGQNVEGILEDAEAVERLAKEKERVALIAHYRANEVDLDNPVPKEFQDDPEIQRLHKDATAAREVERKRVADEQERAEALVQEKRQAIASVGQDPQAFEKLSGELRRDVDVIAAQAAATERIAAEQARAEALAQQKAQEKQQAIAIVDQDPQAFEKLSDELRQDREVIAAQAAATERIEAEARAQALVQKKAQEKQQAIAIVDQDPQAFEKLSDELRRDVDVIAAQAAAKERIEKDLARAHAEEQRALEVAAEQRRDKEVGVLLAKMVLRGEQNAAQFIQYKSELARAQGFQTKNQTEAFRQLRAIEAAFPFIAMALEETAKLQREAAVMRQSVGESKSLEFLLMSVRTLEELSPGDEAKRALLKKREELLEAQRLDLGWLLIQLQEERERISKIESGLRSRGGVVLAMAPDFDVVLRAATGQKPAEMEPQAQAESLRSYQAFLQSWDEVATKSGFRGTLRSLREEAHSLGIPAPTDMTKMIPHTLLERHKMSVSRAAQDGGNLLTDEELKSCARRVITEAHFFDRKVDVSKAIDTVPGWNTKQKVEAKLAAIWSDFQTVEEFLKSRLPTLGREKTQARLHNRKAVPDTDHTNDSLGRVVDGLREKKYERETYNPGAFFQRVGVPGSKSEREWMLNRSRLQHFSSQPSVDSAVKPTLLQRAASFLTKFANMRSAGTERMQTSPVNKGDRGYFREGSTALTMAATRCVAHSLGVSEQNLWLVTDSRVMEVVKREFAMVQGTSVVHWSPENFSELFNRLLTSDARIFLDITTIMAQMCPHGDIGHDEIMSVKGYLRSALDEALSDFVKGSMLKGLPIDEAKLLEKLKNNLIIGSMMQVGELTALYATPLEETAWPGEVEAAIHEIVNHNGFTVGPNQLYDQWLRSGYNFEEFNKVITGIVPWADHPVTYPEDLSGIATFETLDQFFKTEFFENFESLSHVQECPYLSVLATTTTGLLKGLREGGDLFSRFKRLGLEGALQISLNKIQACMQEAIVQKNDLFAFADQVQLIHEELATLLAIAPPEGLEDFDATMRAVTTDMVPVGFPDELLPRFYVKNSGMRCLSSVISACEQQNAVANKLTGLTIAAQSDCYYESSMNLGRAQTHTVYRLKGSDLAGSVGSIRGELSKGEGPSRKLDLYICEFHHNISSVLEQYNEENVTEQVNALFENGMVSDHFTVAIDTTISSPDSYEIRRFLEANKDRIAGGRLNVVFYRSAQKYDLMGMDHYNGGIMSTVNSRDSFKAFNASIAGEVGGHGADALSRYNQVGLAYYQKFGKQGLQNYRAATMRATRMLGNVVLPENPLGVPEEMVMTQGNKGRRMLQFAPNSDPCAVFLDIRNPWMLAGSKLAADFYTSIHALFLAISRKDPRKYTIEGRPSFGYYHSNVCLIGGQKFRFNPGLESDRTLMNYRDFFVFLNELLQEASQDYHDPDTFNAINTRLFSEEFIELKQKEKEGPLSLEERLKLVCLYARSGNYKAAKRCLERVPATAKLTDAELLIKADVDRFLREERVPSKEESLENVRKQLLQVRETLHRGGVDRFTILGSLGKVYDAASTLGIPFSELIVILTRDFSSLSFSELEVIGQSVKEAMKAVDSADPMHKFLLEVGQCVERSKEPARLFVTESGMVDSFLAQMDVRERPLGSEDRSAQHLLGDFFASVNYYTTPKDMRRPLSAGDRKLSLKKETPIKKLLTAYSGYFFTNAQEVIAALTSACRLEPVQHAFKGYLREHGCLKSYELFGLGSLLNTGAMRQLYISFGAILNYAGKKKTEEFTRACEEFLVSARNSVEDLELAGSLFTDEKFLQNVGGGLTAEALRHLGEQYRQVVAEMKDPAGIYRLMQQFVSTAKSKPDEYIPYLCKVRAHDLTHSFISAFPQVGAKRVEQGQLALAIAQLQSDPETDVSTFKTEVVSEAMKTVCKQEYQKVLQIAQELEHLPLTEQKIARMVALQNEIYALGEKLRLMDNSKQRAKAAKRLEESLRCIPLKQIEQAVFVDQFSPELSKLLMIDRTLPNVDDVQGRLKLAGDPAKSHIERASRFGDMVRMQIRMAATEPEGWTIKLTNEEESKLLFVSGTMARASGYVLGKNHKMQHASQVIYNACLEEIAEHENFVNSIPSVNGKMVASVRALGSLETLRKAVEKIREKYARDHQGEAEETTGVQTLKDALLKVEESMTKLGRLHQQKDDVDFCSWCQYCQGMIRSIYASAYSVDKDEGEKAKNLKESIKCLRGLLKRTRYSFNEYKQRHEDWEKHCSAGVFDHTIESFDRTIRELQHLEESRRGSDEAQPSVKGEAAAQIMIPTERLNATVEQYVEDLDKAGIFRLAVAHAIAAIPESLLYHPDIVVRLQKMFALLNDTDLQLENSVVLRSQQRLLQRRIEDLLVSPALPQNITALYQATILLYRSCVLPGGLPLERFANNSVALAFSRLAKTSFRDVLPQIPLQINRGHHFGDLPGLRNRVTKSQGKLCWLPIGGLMARGGVARLSFFGPHDALKIIMTLPEEVRKDLTESLSHLPANEYISSIEASGYAGFGGARVDAGHDIVVRSRDNRITIRVGADPQYWNQYEKISIEVDPTVTSDELYAFVSGLGLATLMLDSRPEDILQIRLARLAQATFPAETHSSIEEWARKGASVPELMHRAQHMQFRPDGDLCQEVDPVALQQFTEAKGVGFGMTVGFSKTLGLLEMAWEWKAYDIQPIARSGMTVSRMCQNGGLSSLERYERGLFGEGCCPDENIQTGSANQVFARPLTLNQFDKGAEWTTYAIPGSVFLLVRPQAAERLPYAYPRDCSGLRSPAYQASRYIRKPQREGLSMALSPATISERVTLPELTRKQQDTGTLLTAEVMFEQLLGRDYIAGMLVATEMERQELIALLKSPAGGNIQEINGVPIEDCVIASPTFNDRALALLGFKR